MPGFFFKKVCVATLLLVAVASARPHHDGHQGHHSKHGGEGEGSGSDERGEGLRHHHGKGHHGHHGPPPMSPECIADLKLLCPNASGPHDAVRHCLTQGMLKDNVTAACKESAPCLVDMFTFCSDARGPHAHHKCVQANKDKFSSECDAQMKKMRSEGHEEGEDGRPFGRRGGQGPPHPIIGLAFICLIFAAGVMMGRGRCCCCKSKPPPAPASEAIQVVPGVMIAKALDTAPPQYSTLPSEDNAGARPLLNEV